MKFDNVSPFRLNSLSPMRVATALEISSLPDNSVERNVRFGRTAT